MNARTKTITLMAAVALGLLASLPALPQGAPAGLVMLQPDELKWVDFPGRPGVKLAMIEGDMKEAGPFMTRLKFQANFKLAPHSHPGTEHVTVISGTLYFGGGDQFDEAKGKAMPPGSVVIIPAKLNHFVWTKEEVVIQTHAVGPWGSTPAQEPAKK